MKTRFLLAVLCALSLPVGAQTSDNLLPNGDFQTLEGDRFANWNAPPTNARVVEEADGNRYLLIAPVTANEVKHASTSIAVPAELKVLRVSARLKAKGLKVGTENWQNARVLLRFDKADGSVAGYVASPELKADSDWQTITFSVDVPQDAARLGVEPGNYGVEGEVGFDDIRIFDPNTASADADLPNGEVLAGRAKEPVENRSSTRAEIVLNGLWKWMPAHAKAENAPTERGWGYLRVPGSWLRPYQPVEIPRVVAAGSGPQWDAWSREECTRGWYEREFFVPASWKERAVMLNLQRASTEARVFVNNIECGATTWPGGEVDISKAVKFGESNTLRVLVTASDAARDVVVSQGTGAGQQEVRKVSLESAGLTGDVVLSCRPQSAFVSDVFVQPSTRKKQLVADVELSNVERGGPVIFAVRAVNAAGKAERSWTVTQSARQAKTQTLRLTLPWTNPKLWDLDQPNLYTLRVAMSGRGIKDDYPQKFGFREFWIQGRQFYLNGRPFRMRPIGMVDSYSHVGGYRASQAGVIDGMRAMNYNIGECWPNGASKRGVISFREGYYDLADRKGFPLMGEAPSMVEFIFGPNGAFLWDDKRNRETLAQIAQTELRRVRNHPSILLWVTSANYFGYAQDQNPRLLGMRNGLPQSDEGWYRRARAGLEGLALMRQVDPTRPYFTHQGADVGDVFGINNYLNFIPLQEREEWLSHWAARGQMPYMAVEFGTPLHCSFMRGRNGGGWGDPALNHGGATPSEPWMTEFSAIYLGPDAYKLEQPAYRDSIRNLYIGGVDGQYYGNWQSEESLNFAPANQRIQTLFQRNTWRSWRMWGISGGMVPWDLGYSVRLTNRKLADQTVPMPWKPGTRGAFNPQLRKHDLFYWREAGGWSLTGSGRVLREVNGPSLAFIAGAPQHTDKTHHVASGANLQKQVALINDEVTAKPYVATWRATLNGRAIATGTVRGSIAPGTNLLRPFAFNVGNVTRKTSGQITLTAQIGARRYTDAFAFRVYAPAPKPVRAIARVFDPEGATTRWLEANGVRVAPYGSQIQADFVVIGRRALSHHQIPGGLTNLQEEVENGARVLIMAQDPEWMRRAWGFRVSLHVTRRAWPVGKNAVFAGIDAEDLRDWNGAGTLIQDKPQQANLIAEPPYGWRWGNRHSVSSAAIEKPHHSGWRPLAECEFDLQYSPLMELDFNQGRVTLCTLDLDGRTSSDPVAERVSRQLLAHVRNGKLSPRAQRVVFYGSDSNLTKMGLIMRDAGSETVTSENIEADLVIAAPDAKISDAALKRFTNAGGKVVFLARRAPVSEGASISQVAVQQRDSLGALDVPNAQEFAGLSASDLRWRNTARSWLLTSPSKSVEVGAGGQLARSTDGAQVWAQLDPERFDADKTTYFRFSRWRQTRALSQVLANMGATFEADARVFNDRAALQTSLATTWRYRITRLVPPSPSLTDVARDEGISSQAQALVKSDAPLPPSTIKLPDLLKEFASRDGEAVLARDIIVPESWKGRDVIVSLGAIDDFDTTFWNGERIGSIGPETKDFHLTPRVYRIPAAKVKIGRNRLAVRMFDHFGGGGFGSQPEELSVRADKPDIASFYHSDYRPDYALGDEPYRYKRW